MQKKPKQPTPCFYYHFVTISLPLISWRTKFEALRKAEIFLVLTFVILRITLKEC